MRRKLNRNVLDLVTGVVALIGAGMSVLSHVFVSGDVDWVTLQVLIALATVACLIAVCHELKRGRYKGLSAFAVVELCGGLVASLAVIILLIVDIAFESGLFLLLSLFGYALVAGGVIGNWRQPLSGGRGDKPHFDRSCKF